MKEKYDLPGTLEFLTHLSTLDVKLWLNEDRLRYSAPQGVLTPKLRAELTQRKVEIIELLHQVDLASRANLPLQPAPRDGRLPLSFAQQRLWFLDQLQPDNFAYNEPAAFTLTGLLNIAALEKALEEIMRRHEILRTTFTTSEGRPAQTIWPPSPFKLPLVDFTAASRPEVEAQTFIRQEIRKPFDLSTGPLLRAYLLRLQPEEHILLVTMHHIVTDGWSTGIFSRELTALYQYFSKETQTPYPLPELPLQYADFAHWQRQWLQGPLLEKQLAYWEQQLGGPLPLLQLPTDHPRPPVLTFQGATYTARLSETLKQPLQRLSQQQGVTLFMTLLAAFKTILYRYTGQEDILIGTPVANRNRSELESLIGFFVNTLVLRTNLAGQLTFSDLLSRVREVALGAYTHQDLPFEKLIERLQPERNLSHQPLFQVMFAFENAPTATLQMSGLSIIPLKLETGAARFDLTLFIEEDQTGLSQTWEYNTMLFEAETITRMAGHFQRLLEGIVAGGVEQPLADLPLLGEVEKYRLLKTWNETQADYPADKPFHHLFEAQVERTPAATALVFGDQQLTYRALNRRANQLAHYLQKLGVGPEVIVALCFERSLDMVVALLAVLKAGGAYLPLDPTYPPARLAFMLQDSRSSLLITQSWLPLHKAIGIEPLHRSYSAAGPGVEVSAVTGVEASAGKSQNLLCLDTDWPLIAQEPLENPASNVGPDHLAYLIYTSGSTGQPKGTMVQQRGLVNYLSWAGQAYPLAKGKGAPVHSSLSFDLTVTALFLPLLAGRTVTLLPEDQTGETLAETLTQSKEFSLVKITPAHLELLKQQLRPEEAAGATKSLIIGGEALFGQDLAFWQSHAPTTRLINEYGPTETVVGCCIYEVPPGAALAGAIPIGRPIANTQLYLLDHSLQPVPIGVPGELYIGGDGVARGYLNRPDLTAERFIPNPFCDFRFSIADFGCSEQPSGLNINTNNPKSKIQNLKLYKTGARLYKTGDLARYRPDGVLEFLGRLDQQVKIRGFRIELGEIETTLKQHPAVKEAAVLAADAPHGSNSKRLLAYIVPYKDLPPTPSLIPELRQFLQARLPVYMLPAVFTLLEALPLTPNGKLDQRALPPPAETRSEPTTAFVASRTQAETILAQLWADLLGLERVGIHDNFFELGGDSILTIQVVARANQAGLRLKPRHLFQYQTIAELAAAAETGPPVQAEQALITGPLPLTPIQSWFFEKNLANPDHWNMTMLLELRQKLDPDLTSQVVYHLLNHHDALRLRFKQTKSGWQQTHTGVVTTSVVSPGTNDQVFVHFDLALMSAAEQAAAIEKQAGALQASLNLAEGPIIRVALFELGPQPDRLLIIIHHLAIDGVSWRILLEDFQTAYRQLSQGQAVQLPAKTTSFQQWANLLHRLTGQQRTLERLNVKTFERFNLPQPDYWLAAGVVTTSVVSTQRHPPPLPVDYPEGKTANSEASAETISVSLSEVETRRLLQEAPAAYHTQINDLLLTALAQAFTAWTGSTGLGLDLEGHGREEIIEGVDLSRTVGWFTTIFPVYLDLEGITQPGEAIKAVKEQLRRIPNRGFDYGLLRYLGQATIRRKLAALPQAEISFNYLGQFDQLLSGASLFKPARESSGPAFSPTGKRFYLLEIVGVIIEGRLQLDWIYSRNIHRRQTIENLSQSFIAALQTLIAHCQSPTAGGYTPSDFPEAALTQAELDNLLATLDDL